MQMTSYFQKNFFPIQLSNSAFAACNELIFVFIGQVGILKSGIFPFSYVPLTGFMS